MNSTPFHLILRLQQVEKRLDAQRARRPSSGWRVKGTPQRRWPLISLPKGSPPIRQGGVAVLGKGSGPFPADCALPWRIGVTLKSAK
jgi:hypothetical protein